MRSRITFLRRRIRLWNLLILVLVVVSGIVVHRADISLLEHHDEVIQSRVVRLCDLQFNSHTKRVNCEQFGLAFKP